MFRSLPALAALLVAAALPTAASAADMFDVTVTGTLKYHRHDVIPESQLMYEIQDDLCMFVGVGVVREYASDQ